MNKRAKNIHKIQNNVKTLASPAPTSQSNEYVPLPLNDITNSLTADSSDIFDFIPEIKGKKY